MNLLRKLAFALATTTLLLAVSVMIISLFMIRIIGNEAHLKTELRNSGLYDAVATDLTSKISINTEEINSEDPIVQTALKDSLNSSTIRKFSEDVITSTFSWLRGDVATPSFTLNTKDLQPIFFESLTSQLKTRLEALPPCPTGVIPETTDPFTATCWPAGVSIDDQLATLTTELQNDTTGAFDTNNLSAKDITVTVNGQQQPYYQALDWLPTYYHWLTLAPWIAALSVLALIGLLVLLASPHEKGYKTAAIICAPIGLILVIAGSFIPQFTFLITNAQTAALKDNTFKDPLQTLANNLIHSTGSFLVIRGVLLLTAGVLLAALYIISSRQRRNKIRTGQLSRPY